VSLAESEYVEKLEILKSLLNKKVEDLKREKHRLDRLANIVKEINKKEGGFVELLSNLEKSTNRMLSYFCGIDVYEEVQSIEQDLQQLRHDYEQKCFNTKEEIAKTKFDDKIIDEYYKHIIEFLDAKERSIIDLARRQKKIFDELMGKVRDELIITDRLINALSKRAEASLKGDELKRALESMRARIKEVEGELPSKVEDLERIYVKASESFQGLYEKTRHEIYSLREKLRRFAIENGLVERHEVTVLEALYTIAHEEGKKGFEFSKALEFLRKKMPETSDEEVQSALLSLSKKGFLVLTLAIE